MTSVAPPPIVTSPRPVRPVVKGSALLGLLQTTDHKVIGMLYLVTSMAFFFVGGSMAMPIRPDASTPGPARPPVEGEGGARHLRRAPGQGPAGSAGR
ncbi:MAG: cytochrome c oxidase subunit [Pseudonocardiales bacterium]|nr:cytochrome c oxidase subunit [Pseudonocardiales bacterium]